MHKLHLRFYLAIVGTLATFLVAGAMLWHHFASPQGAVSGIESAATFAARLIDNAATERQGHLIDALASQLGADVLLCDARGAPLEQRGVPMDLTSDEVAQLGWLLRDGGPAYNRVLADGRHLIVRPRHHFLRHGLHMGLLLTSIAVVLALLTYPITRSITARLARLQQSVQRFGAGDLAARVHVEGRDEVAKLARSFNECAVRIEQLVRAHQLLLANCSHELRTPLARIRLAMERVPSTSPQVSAELARNIAELDALIGEMLLASRLEAARGVERSEPVDVLALAAEEGAHFDREASGAPVTLQADPLLLRRLVRNLLENARMHGGGATEICVEHDDRHVRIIVEDAGAGIPDAEQEKIFEPFYRARSAVTGAGLGLSIVRQIARAHGGTVEYAARAGGGSRFVATLPR